MFAALLLLHDGMTVYMYLTMSAFFFSGVMPYVLAATALEFAGLLILLRITL